MNGGHPCLAGYRQGSRTKVAGWVVRYCMHWAPVLLKEDGVQELYPREIHCGGLNEHGCTCSIIGVVFVSRTLIATRGRWGMYNSL